jgi:hypothetical protein
MKEAEAVDALNKMKDPKLSVAVDFALLSLGDEGAKGRLMKALSSPDAETVNLSAFGLRYAQRSISEKTLEKILQEKNDFRQTQILALLAQKGYTGQMVSKLVPFLLESSMEASTVAFHALSNYAGSYSSELVKAYQADKSNCHLLAILGKAGKKEILGIQMAFIKDDLKENYSLKLALAQAFIFLGDPKQIREVSNEIGSEEASVALSALGENSELEKLKKILDEENLDRRILAVKYAGLCGKKEMISALIESMDREADFQYNKNLDRLIRKAMIEIWVK